MELCWEYLNASSTACCPHPFTTVSNSDTSGNSGGHSNGDSACLGKNPKSAQNVTLGKTQPRWVRFSSKPVWQLKVASCETVRTLDAPQRGGLQPLLPYLSLGGRVKVSICFSLICLHRAFHSFSLAPASWRVPSGQSQNTESPRIPRPLK